MRGRKRERDRVETGKGAVRRGRNTEKVRQRKKRYFKLPSGIVTHVQDLLKRLLGPIVASSVPNSFAGLVAQQHFMSSPPTLGTLRFPPLLAEFKDSSVVDKSGH